MIAKRNDPRFGRTFGNDGPPPESKSFYPLISPKPGTETVSLIASERPVSCWKHYVEGVSYPCPRDRSCPYCIKHLSPRWMAYLSGFDPISGRACLIELTAGAFHSCKELQDVNFNLRGKFIKLTRKGRAPNAPVIAKVEEAPPYAKAWKIPAAFDIVGSLLRMWGNPFETVNPVTGEVREDPPEDQMIPC